MNKKGKKANSYWKMEGGSEHIAKLRQETAEG